MKLRVDTFSDGAVVISPENNPDNTFDLVFAYGAMDGDPKLEVQMRFADELVRAYNEKVHDAD